MFPRSRGKEVNANSSGCKLGTSEGREEGTSGDKSFINLPIGALHLESAFDPITWDEMFGYKYFFLPC